MEKRKVSSLIPYYIEKNEVYIFLQKRSKDAKRLPDYFGFWGGGLKESEIFEEGLKREIKEELGIELSNFDLFSQYEFYGSIKNIYSVEVEKGFEDHLVVGEGEYGKFFTERDVASEQKIINEDRIIIENFFGKMKRGSAFTSASDAL